MDNSPKDNTILISLIIPCYNVPEEQISRALTSAWNQSFHDYEIIVVDDGSAEPYDKILERLCNSNEKNTLIRTDNHGASAARNTGVRAARGMYISFLDADDILAEDFMERAWTAVCETHADLVIGGGTVIDHPEDFHPSQRVFPLAYSLYSDDRIFRLFPHFIGHRFLLRFADGYISRASWARFIRTDLAFRNPFDEDLHIGEDIVWNLQLLNCCKTVCIVPESWYGYWRNPNSASRAYNSDYVEKCRKGLEKLSILVDISDDIIYRSYIDHIYELMRRCWNYYLRKARDADRNSYRATVRSMYTKSPWTELGSLRYMTTGGRYRKDMLLFRLHLYFEVVARRERRLKK